MNKEELKAQLSLCLNEDLADVLSKNTFAVNVNAENFAEWKRTFVGAFLLKHPTNPQVITYIADALNVKVPSWDLMTKVNLIDIKNYICNNISPNSAKTYCAYLASILNIYSDEGVVPCKNVNDALIVKKVPSQHTFLTKEEIEKIHRYKPISEVEATVKRWFLLECYTGARTSDARQLSMKNIKNNMVTYISGKTKVQSCVPMHKNLMEYLVPHPGEKPHNKSVVNYTIRSICKKLDIDNELTLFVAGKSETKKKYEFISTHTARRSFATNLALLGEKIAIISAYMGHTSIDMTSKYIVIDTGDIPANSFFSE